MKYGLQTDGLMRFKRSALAIAIATASPMCFAQGEEVKELPTAQASTVSENSYQVDKSTSPKYTQPLLDTGKTITVIPESMMKDRGVERLRDALRGVSGISLAAGEGGTPTGDSMYIRGFDARNNISIDGVRDIAGYTRDVYNVEAVEVAKGPGSAVYGRGSVGGSVNLQTKTAKLDDFADLQARIDSVGGYRTTIDANKTIGSQSALRVNLMTEDGEVAGRDDVENSTNAIALSFATGLGSRSRLVVNADYQKQDNLPDYGIPWVSNSDSSDPVAELARYEGEAPPVDFSNFYGNVNRDYEDIEAKSLTVKYEFDLASHTTLRATGRVGTVERQSIVTAPRFLDLENSTDVRLSDEKTRDTRDSLTAIQFDLIGRYQTGSIQHDVVAGIELAREKFERWNYVDIVDDNLDSTPETVDLYHPNANVAFTGRYGRDGTSQEATGDTTAVYVFDTLTFNPQWQASFGLRWDVFKTEYQYDYADPSLKLEAEDKELSWSAGVVYKPMPNGSIYASVGTSFSPSAEDLTASDRGNNAELNPEEVISYEVGTKWLLMNGQLALNAALFRTDKIHARTDDPFGADSRDDTLNGKQRVEGLELSAAGQVNKALSLSASYTFQHSEVLNAEGDDAVTEGEPLARTPAHSYSVWGRYQFNEKLAVGLGAQYVGERYNSSDPAGREKADGYLTFDMMASYQITDDWGVQLNGTNLTDEEYVDQIGGGHFIPGEGRHFKLSTSYSF